MRPSNIAIISRTPDVATIAPVCLNLDLDLFSARRVPAVVFIGKKEEFVGFNIVLRNTPAVDVGNRKMKHRRRIVRNGLIDTCCLSQVLRYSFSIFVHLGNS
jgi:hypothetical protein